MFIEALALNCLSSMINVRGWPATVCQSNLCKQRYGGYKTVVYKCWLRYLFMGLVLYETMKQVWTTKCLQKMYDCFKALVKLCSLRCLSIGLLL